jgi:hypothetical protein
MIPVQDARNVFTKQLIATWNEFSDLAPKSFLRSFFTKKTSTTKEVSIEVMRGTEKIAVDVLRGTNGNRNSFSKFSEKIFVPPFFNEYFDATELDKYDLIFGANAVNVAASVVTSAIVDAVERLSALRYKIERAYELQASQIFESGIVQLINGDNIDYKRKAASMIVKDADAYWTIASIDPRNDLVNGANFLRQIGRANDGIFNVIFGQAALTAFFANPKLNEYNISNITLVELKIPQANAEGGIFHGRISHGGYIFNLWSYPEYYDNSLGVSTPYINTNQVYVLPASSGKFVMSFGSIPAIIRDIRNAEFPEMITQVESDFVINNYIDPVGKKHVFETLSAGLAIPVSVDRIYSAQVTGSAVVDPPL